MPDESDPTITPPFGYLPEWCGMPRYASATLAATVRRCRLIRTGVFGKTATHAVTLPYSGERVRPGYPIQAMPIHIPAEAQRSRQIGAQMQMGGRRRACTSGTGRASAAAGARPRRCSRAVGLLSKNRCLQSMPCAPCRHTRCTDTLAISGITRTHTNNPIGTYAHEAKKKVANCCV